MDNIFFINPVYFWLITMILFIGFELATMGLTTMWFALGALAALAVAAVGGAVWLQVIVFFVVSLLALFGFRNLAKDHFNRNRVKTNADSLIGRKGIVTEEVSNIYATGQVTVAGQEWTARSVDD
ncbi:MAG: NfeD family protein, partial [Lachnospiraceae bacterium]|nr:NfeD family protein [Lachnospiraceae bacterium]